MHLPYDNGIKSNNYFKKFIYIYLHPLEYNYKINLTVNKKLSINNLIDIIDYTI